MKKKTWILTGLVAFSVASCFLIIGFSSHVTAQKEKSTCCCQKVNNCASKTNNSASGDMILENLSRQFLSISSLGH